jgi:sodium-dependent phosphate cotransporter
VAALLFVFLVGVKGLGDGFKLLGEDVLDAFFAATSNPFTGLMVGILATTLVQSSSVTTAMIVGLVAAPEHALPIANAVPMIMGANIGTTVTNTIVSMAHMGRPDEFERAFSVATCHDFFNFIAVATLLPLEMATGLLRRGATLVAELLGDVGGVHYESPLKAALKTAVAPIKGLCGALFESERAGGMLLILISATLIFGALWLLVRTLRAAMRDRVELSLNRVLGRNVLLSLAVGIIVTVMVQSSSITTSLLVPLAGAGMVTVREAFPITVGANIGTTVTALLASLAVSGPNARAGVVIALVHFGFNLVATVMILGVPRLRELPIRAASLLAATAVRSRRWAVFYVLVLFYGLPALFAFLFR